MTDSVMIRLLIPLLLGAATAWAQDTAPLSPNTSTSKVGASSLQKDLPVLGWQELVSIAPVKSVTATSSPLPAIEAKLDPGQEISSLQVRHFEIHEDEQTVSFALRDRFGTTLSYRAPLLRIISLKLSGGTTESRPLVALRLCLGSKWIDAEVSIRKHSRIGNPLRIGRSDLAGQILLDPSKSFSIQPDCQGEPL